MKPVVRALIVTEDWLFTVNGGFLQWTEQPAAAATTGVATREFHLGEFLRVLTDTIWVGFTLEITRAHRTPASPAASEAALKADRGADVVGFKFNQPFTVNGSSRTLADYDMVLFFGMNKENADPALAAEAEAIARFMENGGGFFATGDHENLGAALPGLIPRVRSMRRWYYQGDETADSPPGPAGEAPAPPALGPHRHDTTQAGLDGIVNFEDQSDEIPQQIAPQLYAAGFTVKQGYPAHRFLPHPLLCSPAGMVIYLPDHMHEGTCEVPDNLAARTFKLGAATDVREYPDYLPAGAPAGFVPQPLAPEVVATGKVLAGTRSPALDTDAHRGGLAPTEGVDFGVIGAWDGHRVGKGRVVVDSTFHHFFNINLTGDRYLEDDGLGPQHQQKLSGFYVSDGAGGRTPVAEYQMIMWYYRNIIYWLIPASRTETIGWHALSEISLRPQIVEEIPAVPPRGPQSFSAGHYLYFGQLAERYLTLARGACAVFDIHRIYYKPKIPWWEWVQEIVDVWDPVERSGGGERERDQLLGALGMGPRPEVAATLSLGAALVAAASARHEFVSGGSERALVAVQAAFQNVHEHAVKAFSRELEGAARAQHSLGKLAAGRLAAGVPGGRS